MSNKTDVESVAQSVTQNKYTTNGRCKRLTKKELFEFLDWAFAQTDDNMSTYSNPVIADMYYNDTGKRISVSCVRSNRDCWRRVNGEFVKIK